MSLKSKIKLIKHKFKKAKTETDKQGYYDNFAKMVMPGSIIEYPNNLLINNEVLVHSIICGIPPIGADEFDGYPRNMKSNIMDIFADIDSGNSIVTMSQTLLPVNRVTTGRILQDAVVNNDMKSMWDKDENPNNHQDLILKYSSMDLEANFKTHHEANQNMFDSIFIFVIYSLTEKDLRIAKSNITQKLDASLILFDYPTKNQMKAFLLAMGMPMTHKESEAYRIQIFSRVAAVLSPLRVQSDAMANKGLYYGDLVKTNKNLLINLDNLPAKHKLIFGSTGSGKTVGMLTWCLRAHDMLGYRIIYMTDKGDAQTDFLNIVKSYGDVGQTIDIGPGMDNINPMQIFYDPATIGTSNYAYESAYDAHKGMLKGMYNAWKKDGLTTRQEALLDMHIDDCYERKGILRSVPSTWTGEWPLISDLLYEFKQNEDDVSSQALYDMSYPLGPKGELNYLSRPTTVKFDKSFMIINLSSVPESFKKAQNVIVTGIISLRFNTSSDKTTIIAVDEAGSLMRDPRTTASLLNINVQGRSSNVFLWLGTQQPHDIIKAGVMEQMENNMFLVCLFGRKSTEKGISALSKHFGLDTDSQSKLLSCDVGECLIMVENNVYHTKINLSPFESNILLNSEASKQTTASVTKIKPEVYKIATDHGVFFKDLIEGSPGDLLDGRGFESRRNQDPIGRGQTYFWINSVLISTKTKDNKEVEMIGVQSLDHYVTVVRIASYMANKGISVQINHTSDVDLVIEINDQKIALEYERPGSHCSKQINEKEINALKKYDAVYFITTSLNYDTICENINKKYVVKRGIMLKELLDGFITENLES